MYIKFGNLTVREFAEKVGTEFTDEEVEILESHRSDPATFDDPDKFHIFLDPAISINIGAEAFESTKAIWVAANARKPFNREISFHPLSVEDLANHNAKEQAE